MATPKVALVTGSGKRRVGRHVADALAARGYALVIHYRSSKTDADAAVIEPEDTRHALDKRRNLERPVSGLRPRVEMDVSAHEPKRGRVHVDRPVLEESEAIPLRDPIGDGRTMDAYGTGRRLEAHPIAPKVRSAPDHHFPQDVEVEFVENVEMVRTGKRLATVSKLGIDFQNIKAS